MRYEGKGVVVGCCVFGVAVRVSFFLRVKKEVYSSGFHAIYYRSVYGSRSFRENLE